MGYKCLDEEARMAILIKCNGTHLSPGDEQIFTLPIEDGIMTGEDPEVFVWVNERSRELPWGNGLSMRGAMVSWGRAGRRGYGDRSSQ